MISPTRAIELAAVQQRLAAAARLVLARAHPGRRADVELAQPGLASVVDVGERVDQGGLARPDRSDLGAAEHEPGSDRLLDVVAGSPHALTIR
ncbi:MAG: hypothetical protein U0802_19880 [Candidatus Binatia bacterium]